MACKPRVKRPVAEEQPKGKDHLGRVNSKGKSLNIRDGMTHLGCNKYFSKVKIVPVRGNNKVMPTRK